MNALTTSHWIPDRGGPPLLAGATIGSRLREVAAEVPDRVALVEGLSTPERRRWTYAELLADAERCARYLLQHFEPGERVAVWAHNLPEWVLLEYGAALAGLTLVTVNPSLHPAEATYVLGQSRTAGLFLVPEVRGNRLAAHAEAIRADLPGLRHVLRLDQLVDLVGIDGRDVRLPAVGPDDPAQIQYTSGTTGLPKGAVLRHGSIVNNARLWADRVEIPDGAGWLLPLPLFHTGGCVLGVLGALDRRAMLVLMPMFEPGLFLELIELRAAVVRQHRPDDAHRRDGPPGRVAPRPVARGGRPCPAVPRCPRRWCGAWRRHWASISRSSTARPSARPCSRAPSRPTAPRTRG